MAINFFITSSPCLHGISAEELSLVPKVTKRRGILIDGHAAKVTPALRFAHYNFVRVHSSLRGTPATAAGVTERVWETAEIARAGVLHVSTPLRFMSKPGLQRAF